MARGSAWWQGDRFSQSRGATILIAQQLGRCGSTPTSESLWWSGAPIHTIYPAATLYSPEVARFDCREMHVPLSMGFRQPHGRMFGIPESENPNQKMPAQ